MDRKLAGDILREQGFKVTAQRLDVMLCLDGAGCCLSAEEIRQRLEQRACRIGLPTVYRILDELAAAGIITRIFMPNRKQYFYLCSNREHHHHFVCEACRRVEDVHYCGLDGVISEMALRSGASITSHILQINGVCGACNGARGKRV